MDLSPFLERLKGVRQNGQGFKALCPAHDDRTPSLSVSGGDGGRILLKCHVGCSVEQIVAALGLTMRDLFGTDEGHPLNGSPVRKPSPTPSPAPLPPVAEELVFRLQANMTPMAREYLRRERMLSPEIIDRYQLGIDAKNGERRVTIPIRDADGEIQDIRRWMPPESRKVGSRKMLAWEKGRGATRLFPMDQLEHDELVFGEGELDALAAISHNIPTITLTNGADTVPDEQQARLFAGKVVTVLLDHDEAGRKGVLKKSEALAPYAREVRIASWPEE